MKRFKTFLVMMLALLALVTAGCFQGETNLTIREDGSSTMTVRMLGNDFVQELIQEGKQDLQKEYPDGQFQDITEGDKSGFAITDDYKDMNELANKGGDLFGRIDGKNNMGISVQHGWFYDSYDFDLLAEASQEAKDEEMNDPQVQAMVQEYLKQIKYDFNLTLPVAPLSHNADDVSADGKTLHWDLASTLVGGEDKSIRVTYQVKNESNVTMTGAIIAVLAIVGVVALVMWKRSEGGSGKRNLGIVAIVLAIALAAFMANGLNSKPTFSASDSISPILTEEQVEGDMSVNMNGDATQNSGGGTGNASSL